MVSERIKIYPYQFSENEMKDGCKKCIQNVNCILVGARMLMNSRITVQYAIGLYIYAVEEYGKAILLKKCITGEKEKYYIPDWILGKSRPDKKFNAHDLKIIVGFDNLPSQANYIRRAIIINNPSDKDRPVRVEKGKITGNKIDIRVGKYLTGLFENTTNINAIDYNLDLKTSCFYMDWDLDNKDWRYKIVPDKNNLLKCIDAFEESLKDFDCNN
jgi:hypothetical protein